MLGLVPGLVVHVHEAPLHVLQRLHLQVAPPHPTRMGVLVLQPAGRAVGAEAADWHS